MKLYDFQLRHLCSLLELTTNKFTNVHQLRRGYLHNIKKCGVKINARLPVQHFEIF